MCAYQNLQLNITNVFNLQNEKSLRNLNIFPKYHWYLSMTNHSFKYLSETENYPEYCS